MDSSKPKRTVFLKFTGIASETGGQVTICEEMQRHHFFKHYDKWGDSVKHYYEGNRVNVYALFQSDTFDTPDYETGLHFVIAWFDGKFERKHLYDVLK